MSSENQFDLAKTELKLVQDQMDKYDGLLAKIKTWTITLWAASLGWSFQAKQENILLLCIFIVLAFWALDAFNKNFRQGYKKRRNEVAAALRKYFQTFSWPENFISPDLPRHRTAGALKKIFQPHVFLLYIPLIAVALALYFL